LLEDAELIANPVAQSRHFECGERIDEACGQTSQTTDAQTRLVLLRKQIVKVEPELRDGLLHLIVDA
jgi:hypothetical protein